MTSQTDQSGASARMQEGDSLAMCRYNFSELELVACSGLVATARSQLSILPPQTAADTMDCSGAWDRLEEEGVVGPGTERLLTGLWEFAFCTLACARTRLRLLLGAPSWIEQSLFFAAGKMKNGEMVIALPSEDGCSISFPASPEDVLDLALDHLDVKKLREETGFRERFTGTEYAALLAAACVRDGSLTSDGLLKACSAAGGVGADVTPTTWGGTIAPWPLELDASEASKALASFHARGMAYSFDGAHHESSLDLSRLLRSLQGMERYVAVDCLTETRAGQMERVCFAIVLGDSSLWQVSFCHHNNEPSVTVQSIGLFHIRSAMERLIDLSWIHAKEATVNAVHEPAVPEVLNYEFTEEEIELLLKESGVAPGSGSPLGALRPRGASHQDEARRTLAERKLFDGATMEPQLAQAVRTLAQPSVTLVEVGGSLHSLNVSRRYIGVEAESTVAVGHACTGPDSHVLRFPLGPRELFPISESLLHSGRGGQVAPFTAVLDPGELAALAALVDLYRQDVLNRILKRQAGLGVTVTAQSLMEIFETGNNGDDRRWLVTLLRDLWPVPLELIASDTPAILMSMAQKGLLRPAIGSAYHITPDCAAFCHVFSLAEAALGIAMTAQNWAAVRPVILAAFWTSGMIWTVHFGPPSAGRPQMSLQTVLPAELRLELAAAYSQVCNDARSLSISRDTSGVLSPLQPTGRQPLSSEKMLCPKCRAEVPIESNFCLRCGADLMRKVTPACPICQTPIADSSVAFCLNCGARLRGKEQGAFAPAPPSPTGQPSHAAVKAGPSSTPPPPPPVCTQCGASQKVGQKFCTSCGNPLKDSEKST